MYWIDPLGLTQRDVDIIDSYIKQHFPDIHRRGGYVYGTPNPGAEASTDPWTGVTTLPSEMKCKKLTQDEFYDLFSTMLHESMHSTDPWWQAWWDGFNQPALTANHQAIYNREQYETVIGHRFVPGPMWGKPTNFIPDPNSLYRNTRNKGN